MRARLATKVNSRVFCQATYRGRAGDVKYELFVGANLTPTGIELFRLSRGQVEGRRRAQHAARVSSSVDLTHEEPTMVMTWEELGASYEEVSQLRTMGLKRRMKDLLACFGYEYV